MGKYINVIKTVNLCVQLVIVTDLIIKIDKCDDPRVKAAAVPIRHKMRRFKCLLIVFVSIHRNQKTENIRQSILDS